MPGNAAPVAGPGAAWRLLRIVALLLPLTAALFQVVLSASSRRGVTVTDEVYTILTTGVIILSMPGFLAIGMLIAGGTSLVLTVALAYLAVGLAAVLLVTIRLTRGFMAPDAADEGSSTPPPSAPRE